MSLSPSRRRAHRAALALGMAVLVLGQPGPSMPQPNRPGDVRAAPGDVRAAPGDVRAAVASPQPPDGRWLRDTNGAEYYVDTLPRQAGLGYKKVDAEAAKRFGGGDDLYMSPWGIAIRVVRMDDEWVYYKVFRVDHVPERPRAKSPLEELATIEPFYRSETGTSSLLSFQPFDAGLPRAGQWRQGFAVGDLNGDGHLDIVHPPPRKGGTWPVVFLGDGRGNWRVWQEVRFPEIRYDYGQAAVADYDGDGRLDIALGMHLIGVTVLVQKQPGRFELWNKGLDMSAPGPARSAAAYTSRAIAAADWNGDGRPDILALGEGPRVQMARGAAPIVEPRSYGIVVYLNQGDGTWRRKDDGTGPTQLFGDAIDAADLDGDGHLDILTASSQAGRRDLVHLADGRGGWRSTEIAGLRPRAQVQAIKAGDFDGDGRLDLAVAFLSYEAGRWWTGVDVFLARNDGWQRRVLFAEQGNRGVWALAIGDLDGDGAKDVAGLTGDGDVLVFRGDGRGGFARETSPVHERVGGCRGYHVELVDLDRDGRAEIVAGFAGEPGGGLQGVLSRTGCPGHGSLRAWKAVPSTAGADQRATPQK